MEDNNNTSLDTTIKSSERQASVIPQEQFSFVPVESMFESPETDLAAAIATNPDEIALIDQHKVDIDRYGIDAMANLGVARPTLATDTFDPVLQQNPPQNTYSNVRNILQARSDGPAADVVAPTFSGIRANNFLRYFEHPEFEELGYRPYANMEEYYNANSTVWDDMARMRGQFGSLVGSGFTSVYRSIGDLFDDDAYFTAPDLNTATEFEDAMAIGNSSRGGALAWTNNLLLNSGYTFGIIGSIAVEELALAGATVLTGGGAAPVAATRTGYNVLRLGKLGLQVPKFFSKSREFLNTLRNVDAAKDFWSAASTGGKVLGQMFTPNTIYAIKNLKTTKNTVQNGFNLAKMRAGFGGFYRDLRAVNLAVAESKLEGGMVYNEIVREGVDIMQNKSGGTVTPDEMATIQSKAAKGAYYTSLANAPIIYASNWFVLGNALGGFNRSLGRVFNDSFRKGFAGRIIKTKATRDAAGKLNKNVFSDAGAGFKGWLKKVRAGGIKGNAGMAAAATLRYFAANVAEGIQEVSQEAVSSATRGYFTTVLEDPMAGGIELQNDMILSGMGDQLSGEGFSVFMSGFLMGGIVQGPQKLFFQGVPAIYDYGLNPLGINVGTQKQKDAFAEYKKNKEELIKSLVETHNNAWNSQVDDPTAMFDPNKLNFMVQKQVADAMKSNVFDQDKFGFIDQKDFAKFQQMYTIFQMGTSNIFRGQLQDYLTMTDEELAEAFPSSKTDIKQGKIRSRIQDMINNIDKVEDQYNEAKNRFQNPFDRTQYKKGTREYIQEALKESAYEHARYLYMFTQDGFTRALERSNSIFQNLANDPLFENMAASDMTVLLDLDAIDNELRLLATEIIINEGDNATTRKDKKKKEEKLKRLTAIKAILTDPKNLTKSGAFDRRKISTLRKEFYNYVRYMASSAGSFVDNTKIDEALKEVVDYHALKDRAKVYDKAIEYLQNPERFNEIVDRQLEINKEIYKNLQKRHKQNIEKYIEIVEANQLVNELAELGVYGDPTEVKNFLMSGNANYLKSFYTEQGLVDKRVDKAKYEQIQRKLDTYRKATEVDTTEATETSEKQAQVDAQETKNTQDQILEDNEVDVILPETNNTPMLNELLERRYKRYASTQAVIGEKVLPFEEWRNTEEGLTLQNTFNAIKKVWAQGYYTTDAKGNAVFVEVSEADLKSEKGFKEYLNSREARESDLIASVLKSAGLEISDIVEQEEILPEEGDIVKGDKNKTIYKKGIIANVIKITTIDPVSGDAVALFKLVDSQGNNLPSALLDLVSSQYGTFDNASSAVAALKKIEKTAPDSADFLFDDVVLNQGMLVYDKNGKEFVVLSTPKQIQGGYLRLVASEDNIANVKEREKKVIKLQEGQFANNYSVQELKFEVLPKNVSRLNISEPITPYPHMNFTTGESREGALSRYNAIISELTPAEIAALELVVTLDPQGGTESGFYTIPGNPSNPYIKIKRSKYVIGLRINNPDTQARVNLVLERNGIPQVDSDQNIFAYLPNQNVEMVDPQGNIIDPRNMSRDQANNTIFVSNTLSQQMSKPDILKLAQNNFALNALLVSTLDSLGITSETTAVLSANDLPFSMSIIIEGGVMDYDNSSTRSLRDLNYQSADNQGNFLVYDLKMGKDGKRTEQSITNLEGSEARALRDQVEAGLKAQGLWNQMIEGTDRYVAAVLLPNGTYGLVNLKAEQFSAEDLTGLATDLVERAQLTQKENLDDKGKEKDLAYNSEYNAQLGESLFISTIPGYTVQLQVNPFGKIQMQLFDKTSQQQVGKTVELSKDKINDTSLSVSDKMQTLIDSFNEEADIKASGVSISGKNFRNSFPDGTTVEEIISKTSTNVTPQVIKQQKLRLTADSAAIQASRDVDANTDRKVEPIARPEPTVTIAEEAEESILDLSEEEFNDYAADDFVNMPSEFMEHIVNKKLRGEELNDREKQVERIKLSEITLAVAKRGGEGSVTIETETETVEKKDSLSQVIRQLDELKAQLLEGVDGRSRNKVLRENKEYQDLLKIRKALEKEANKVLPAELSNEDIEDINAFTVWASDNLPDYIDIQDIATLGNNLKAGGVRVGAFVLGLNNIAGNVKVSGTIYTGARSPFKYHEAFHGVFRMLLSDQDIARYRSIARKEVRAKLRAEGKSFEKELQRFRNSADTYTNMSRKELENEYYEEYMADEFEKFKTNPKSTKTDASIKSLFTRILDWIRSVFSSYNKNELQTLFEKIDSGKFKGASIASNEFTAPLVEGISVEANALIPYASERSGDKVGYIYLDSDIADPMIRSIAAMFLNRTSAIEGAYNPQAVLNELMDDFAWLYSPDNPTNQNKDELQKKRLSEIELAFDNYSQEILEETVKLLNIISDQDVDQEFTVDEFQDDTGLRTTSQYDKDASLIGGFRSLSSKLRAYIATTTVASTDYFGNEELVDGEKLIVAVNFVDAYNGLLKSVKSIEDPLKILQSMYFFGQDNPQAGAVVNRILQDVGISEEELLSGASLPVELKNAPLLQSILKGFENFRVDYIFNERDSQGNIRIYSASERDDINSQLDRWSQAFISKRKQLVSNPKRKRATKNLLEDISSDLQVSEKAITNVRMENDSKKYSELLFDLVGIKLSPMYLQFSMVANRPSNKLTVKQKALVNLYAQETPLSVDDVNQLNLLLQQDQNIFATDDSGMSSRLKVMSINNAPFDETIGASVFKNPNGDLVYAHQLPTYHLKKVASLNNQVELEKIKDSDPYMDNNYLLNNSAFNKMSEENRLKVTRVAGSKVGQSLQSESDINDNISGVTSTSTYGDFTPQEFALSIINNYTALFNTKSNRVQTVESLDEEGKAIVTALAPVLIRVMEASNTGDMINLPVIKAVEFVNGEAVLTEEAVDVYVNQIRTEFSRINRESNEATLTGEEILGYNSIDGRAYKLHNTRLLLSNETKTKLEGIAVSQGKDGNPITLDESLKFAGITMTQLRKEVVDNLEIQFNEFQELITELKIKDQISKNITDGLVVAQGVSRKNTIASAKALNLNFDETHNLKQIFFNDWINSNAINEILLGDQAVSLKDSVDQVKRAKMQNASYYSAYSAVTAPELGVTHPVEDISLVTLEEPKSGNIDVADAQMYITTKAFRYMFFGFGKLSPAQAKLITDVENGIPISSDRIFGTAESPEGLAKMQAMLNSKKLVYGDGSTFLKMSAFVLTPDYTSNWDGSKWVAKPNRVALHNLRVKLEAIEDTKDTISIAAPLSAIKMKKQRINSLDDLKTDSPFSNGHTTLDARFMGLQVLNPSNKLEIVDPTQIKEIATSEQKDDVFVDGLNMTVGEIRQAYNDAVSRRVVLKYKNKRNLIFSLDTALDEFRVSKEEGAITPNLSAFLNYAVAGLKASQASSNLLEFFSTTDGVQNYNLNNPITIKKFEQLFFSYFSRGVLSERTPGVSLTLVSDFGNSVYRRVFEIDENGVPVRSEVIRQDVWERMANKPELSNIEDLTNNNIPKEGVVVLDRLRSGLMEYDAQGKPTGQRYTEMMMPAHQKEVMDLIQDTDAPIPDVVAKMFGVRIPSQDNHSTVNMKMVDFLPVYFGSSAMFAEELIEISGADFDIDKVFAQIKEFYVKDDQFIEYGKGKNVSEKYSEYVQYVNNKVEQKGTQYSEALGIYNNREGAARIQNSVDDVEQDIATDAGLSENALNALKILGLPITQKQYGEYVAKHGEPYEAPMNNDVLDYRYALMGNRGVTEGSNPISYQPATTDVLTDTLDFLASQSEVFAERVQEDNVDVDNLSGKIKAFRANKGASIGAIVLPNLYLSLLTEYNIKLNESISINGKSYNNFGRTLDDNGQRKQDTLSALITMATDNAKDRLVAKLGLNRHAMGVVANLTALGVPIQTSILLINHPVIQDLYSEALNKKDKLDPGMDTLVRNKLAEIKKEVKAEPVNDRFLLDVIDNPQDESAGELKGVLSLFSQVLRIKNYTGKMGAVTSLSKGLGKNVASIREKSTDIKSLFAQDAPMDLSPIYKGKTWQNQYLKIFYQITDDLLPATFLTASASFNSILSSVLDNMDTRGISFNEEVIESISTDLLSYLTIKAYQQNQLENDQQRVATLSNDILYPTDYESINDIINRLKGTEEGANNFFLDNFIISLRANEVDNQTGLNLANANTFRNLSAAQKVDLQSDFAKLFGSVKTKNDAMSIVNYIMVKDGLQVKYASLLEAISPFVIGNYLDQINSVEKALRGEASFESVFGMSQEELQQEFENGYLLSNVSGAKLYTFVRNEVTGSLPQGVSVKDDVVTVAWEKMGIENPPKYLRVGVTNILSGVTNYKTYGRIEESNKYEVVETMGSNQQTAIGFMFGDRPTYKSVRDYVKKKNQDTSVTDITDSIAIDETKGIQEQVLKNDNSNIEATESSVEVQLDPEAEAVNLANTAALLEQLGMDTEAQDRGEAEANVIDDVDQSLPEVSQVEEQLMLDFETEIDEQYPEIADFWDANIQGNKDAMRLLRAQKILSLEDFIGKYEEGVYDNTEQYLDFIKSCILK